MKFLIVKSLIIRTQLLKLGSLEEAFYRSMFLEGDNL